MKYQKLSAHMVKQLLSWAPATTAAAAQCTESEINQFKTLAERVIKGFEKSQLGKKFFCSLFLNEQFSGEAFDEKSYVPIGSYHLFEENGISTFNNNDVSPQAQDLLLKEPIRKIKRRSEIVQGHKMKSYLTKTSTFMNMTVLRQKQEKV